MRGGDPHVRPAVVFEVFPSRHSRRLLIDKSASSSEKHCEAERILYLAMNGHGQSSEVLLDQIRGVVRFGYLGPKRIFIGINGHTMTQPIERVGFARAHEPDEKISCLFDRIQCGI